MLQIYKPKFSCRNLENLYNDNNQLIYCTNTVTFNTTAILSVLIKRDLKFVCINRPGMFAIAEFHWAIGYEAHDVDVLFQ